MIRAAVIVLLLLTGAIGAHAQSVSVVPSFGMTEVYDDNVFYRPQSEADTITRITPGIDARYMSQRLTVAGRYVLDADRFAAHSELSTVHGRQDGGVDAKFQSSRRMSFSGTAGFFESQTPADLNEATGLTPGRVRAQRFTLQPSATYAIDPNTEASAAYTMTSDRLAGGVSLLSQSATSTLGHRLSNRSDLKVEHVYQRYLFGMFDRAAARTSQTLTVEWTHGIDRLTSLSLRAGPRVTDGVFSPEIAASVRRHVRAGDASLSYQHTQTTLIGLAGIADTHSVTAMFSSDPHQRLTLHAGPGVLYTRQADLSSTVYRLSLSCARPVASRLSLEAAYNANFQHGNVYTGRAIDTIARNVASFRLVVRDTTPARKPSSTTNDEPGTTNEQ